MTLLCTHLQTLSHILEAFKHGETQDYPKLDRLKNHLSIETHGVEGTSISGNLPRDPMDLADIRGLIVGAVVAQQRGTILGPC
jgi:hypothetical protein